MFETVGGNGPGLAAGQLLKPEPPDTLGDGEEMNSEIKADAKKHIWPEPRVNFCWYCSRQLRNKAFAEVEVDGAKRIVHKQCAKWISRGDFHQAEHPEEYGLTDQMLCKS